MGDCRELWATHDDCARSRGMIQPAAADRFPNLLHWIFRGPSPLPVIVQRPFIFGVQHELFPSMGRIW
jgi:hypothetical protein